MRDKEYAGLKLQSFLNLFTKEITFIVLPYFCFVFVVGYLTQLPYFSPVYRQITNNWYAGASRY